MPLLFERIAKVARNEALFTRDGKGFVTFPDFPRNDVRATDVNRVLLRVFLQKFPLRIKTRVKTPVQAESLYESRCLFVTLCVIRSLLAL